MKEAKLQVSRLCITNFRGIKNADLYLPSHSVLTGDNNTGKTTILEAIDLALGPDRLNRVPPIDEHDFFRGQYLPGDTTKDDHGSAEVDESPDVVAGEAAKVLPNPRIRIDVTLTHLTPEQIGRFGDHIEFWDFKKNELYDLPDPAGVDKESIVEAVRVTFFGTYVPDEDDFIAKTFFTRTLDNPSPQHFTKKDKQVCGFLYLRSHRTGSRALSLDRGSLLDIILRLKELRPQMWEDTIGALESFTVASEPELGITGVLQSIDAALKKYVPKEWGVEPHLKVSALTREHLRKVVTAFIATGSGKHAAPYYRQGTGTLNMLVLAMLSLIAEDKQNVVFGMEEPETAIPPYAQKRIVHEIRKLASQTIFTSHSPYVLEEFCLDELVVVARDEEGAVTHSGITLPESIKLKRYRQEFRTRFCEGLLSRRVLVAEGATETAAVPVASRRLAELKPDLYVSLEALGICVINAGGETNIADMAALYKGLGKQVFAVCDKQSGINKKLIEEQVDLLLMHEEKGIEDLVLKKTTVEALSRFCNQIAWPEHLLKQFPQPALTPEEALREYFKGKKAEWGIADFLAQCQESEIPEWLRNACLSLRVMCDPIFQSSKPASKPVGNPPG